MKPRAADSMHSRVGGCRCGDLGYTLSGPLGPVMNCHCGFCRRIHGAAFATVMLVPHPAFAWLDSSAEPAQFVTPMGNVRNFCGRCAAPVYNFSPVARVGSLIVSSLEGEQPSPWAHINTESKATWLALSDDLPRFDAWPSADELRGLARQHADARIPEALLALLSGPEAGS